MQIKDLSIYIPAHEIVSREVKSKEDIERVVSEGEKIFELLKKEFKYNHNSFAIAHSQITKDNPLRFFVTLQEVYVNPRIIKHTSQAVPKTEGCLTFRWKGTNMVNRFYRVIVEFQTINDDNTLSEVQTRELKGLEAQIWQHEIDHMEGNYIFKDEK